MNKDFGELNPLLSDADFDSLLSALDESSLGKTQENTAKLEPRKDSLAPLSPSQQALWFLHTLDPSSAAYTIFSAFKLTGKLDLTKLSKAVDFVIESHEALRMRFYTDASGQTYQVPVTFSGSVLNIENCQNKNEAIQGRLKKESQIVFDLQTNIPARFTLLNLGNDQFIFSIAIHHIVIDAFSIEILIHDIGRAYCGDFSLKTKLQFADYVSWKAKNTSQQAVLNAVSRVAERLSGIEPLNFPTDFPRPKKLGSDGEVLTIIIENSIAHKLQKLARDQDASPFMVFAAAFGATLARFSRQSEFVLGTSFLDRNHPELNGVIGFFINMMALKCDLSNNPNFCELIQRMRSETLLAIDDADAPFGQVVKSLHIEPDQSRHPLFQAAISLFPGEQDKESHPFTALSIEQVAEQTSSRFDIEILMRNLGDSYVGSLIWNRGILAENTMQSFANSFKILLKNACENPDIPVNLLNAGTEPLFISDTSIQLPSFRLENKIQQVVQQFGSKIAVQCMDQEISYEALWEWSSGIALQLIKSGVKEGDRVGLSVRRSLPLIASMLGILRAGAAYVPLDPDYPSDRLSNMLEDAQIQICLGSFSDTAFKQREDLLVFDPLTISPEKNSSNVPVLLTPPNLSLAYVLFTSGSTGRPKGVSVTHHNVARLFTSTQSWFEFDHNDIWSMFHSYAFDFSVWEIFGALLHGSKLIIIPEMQARDTVSFIDILHTGGVTIVSQTPSAFKQFLTTYFDNSSPPILRLRHIIFGGEALNVSSLKQWFDYFGDREPQLTNMYGITETTVHVTYRPIRIGDLEDNYYSPIGIPLPDLSLRLVDENLNDVPRGGVGEILVGGDGVTNGYLGLPELTSSRFLKTGQGSQIKWYRSGDLARLNFRNELIFLGRSDQQVKVRGFRIELGDIQAAFTSHHLVSSAEIILQNTSNDSRLVAYVVPKNLDFVEMVEDQLENWQDTFTSTYSAVTKSLDQPDFIGWNSSYDGKPIQADEMQLWLEETLRRIKELKPKKVLEIGCGTGMILGGLGEQVEQYVGLDAADKPIEFLRSEALRKNWQHVKLYTGDSLKVLEKLASDSSLLGNFDVIIINSVIQYFPTAAYLEKVLQLAAHFLCPMGNIYLGDLRANATINLHHLSLAMRNPAQENKTLIALKKRLLYSKEREVELLVDPGAIEAMLAFRNPSIWPRLKDFNAKNEISYFRYDIVIQLDHASSGVSPDVIEVDGSLCDLEELEKVLNSNPSRVVIIRSLYNSRTFAEQQVWESIEPFSGLGKQPIEFTSFVALGERLNRPLVHYWLEQTGTIESVLNPIFLAFVGKDISPFDITEVFSPFPNGVSDPLAYSRKLKLVDDLRQHVEALIPAHMVPSVIMTLSRFPLTPTGKLDRKLLPDPDAQNLSFVSLSNFRPPRNPSEILICQLFTELTGSSPISLDTNFFSVGGHSLLAMRLIAKLKESTGINLRLGVLFENPTPETLAHELIFLSQDASHPIVPGIGQLGKGQIVLSYGQKRLWLLDQIDGPSPTYNIPLAMRLRGQLNQEALASALTSLMMRHESLRTVIKSNAAGDPEGFLMPGPDADSLVLFTDLSHLPIDQANEVAVEMIKRESEIPFNLADDYALRIQLVQLSPAEHILMLTLHHHAGDGVSMGILARELSESYEAYCFNSAPSWPALSIQYSDWAAWQKAYFEKENNNEDNLVAKVERARLRLNGFPSQLDLPTDFSREPGRQRRAQTVNFLVPKETVQRIDALALEAKTTAFSVVLASYALALAKISRQYRLVIGSPVAGRSLEETQSLVGFFVNTLAVPVDISCVTSGIDLLEQVKQCIQDCLIDQDLPFERLVEELGVPRSLSYSPVFQVALSFHTQDMGNLHFHDLSWSQENALIPIAKYDLNLHIGFDSSGAYSAALIYDADLFTKETIEIWAQSYIQILNSFVSTPNNNLFAISLVDKIESKKLLEWTKGNSLPAQLKQSNTIGALFDLQLNKNTEKTALIFQNETLSYQELDQRANQLARYLIQEGIGAGVTVAFLLDRSIEMIVTILAIVKSGAAYLPLDTGYPALRLTFMIEDSGAKILITKAATFDQFELNSAVTAKPSIKVLDLDDLIFETRLSLYSISPIREDELLSIVSADNIAYLIYTSGSTGVPKGVANTQSNVCSLAYRQVFYRPSPNSTILQFSSIAFDAATFEIWAALLNGGRLVIANPGQQSLEEIRHTIDKYEVNSLFFTSMLFSEAIQNLPELFEKIENVYVGGEVLPPIAAKLFLHTYPDINLWNMYGPTETTTFALSHQISLDDLQLRAIPIGRPINGYEVFVLDEAMQMVPNNVVGELYIGGAGVAREYFRQPRLTAERFVPNPFGVDGARLYRTGDLVSWRTTACIDFIGRVDNQIKMRGFRIELDEIQNVVLEQFKTYISQAVVILNQSNGIASLCAYVVLKSNQKLPLEEDIKRILAKRLPEYMVPSTFIAIDALPLNANGKLDRAMLPLPDKVFLENAVELPLNSNEEYLCSLYSELTGGKPAGRNDSFFVIGGHSLLAIRLVSRLRQDKNIDIPLRVIFSHPSPRELAEFLAGAPTGTSYSPLLLIKQGTKPLPLFCVHPGGGFGTVYRTLAASLADDQTVYALQARGLEAKEEPHQNIKEMASAYVDAIRTIQVHGPYQILGWSFGGVVAHEMAFLLEGMGEQVSFLALLDAPASYPKLDRQPNLEEMLGELIKENLKNEERSSSYSAVDIPAQFDDRLEFARQLLLSKGLIMNETPVAWVERTLLQFSLSHERLKNHINHKINSKIVFFSAQDQDNPEITNWAPFTAGGVEIIEIPAPHTAMLNTEFSLVIAHLIQGRLQ